MMLTKEIDTLRDRTAPIDMTAAGFRSAGHGLVDQIADWLEQLPGGPDNSAGEPINVPDGKTVLPEKSRVLTGMEELIHQFILVTHGVNAPPGEIYFSAENPKGELGFYIHSKGGGTPHRLKIRAPSFVNLSILPWLLPNNMMSDVVSILGSLDFVMGECDR